LQLFNQALLGKWLWRFINKKGKPWRKVVETKYGEAGFDWFHLSLVVLTGIAFGCIFQKDGRNSLPSFPFEVGDGCSIYFWQDRWCDGAPLRDIFPALLVLAVDRDSLVADYWERAYGTNVWAHVFVQDASLTNLIVIK